MKEGRDNTLLLTVIGIATLLVAVAGATFAYFTAQTRYTDENASTLTIYSSNGVVNKLEGGSALTVENIYPINDRVWATKVLTYTTTAGTTGADQMYTLKLHYTNTFANDSIAYKLTAVESTDVQVCSTGFKYGDPACTPDTNSNAISGTESFVTGSVAGLSGTFANASTEQTISFPGGIVPITTAAKHVYMLEITYPNGSGNQNADQGKNITIRMSVDAVYAS